MGLQSLAPCRCGWPATLRNRFMLCHADLVVTRSVDLISSTPRLCASRM